VVAGADADNENYRNRERIFMRFIRPFVVSAVGIVAAISAVGCATSSSPQGHAFASPESAADALVTAAQTDSPDELNKVLGPEGNAVVSSGDPIADAADREAFVAAYQERHSFVSEGDHTTLFVGTDPWPFPIPLVKSKKGWAFDTARGKDEIIDRRIGRNELATIEVCKAFVDAQTEYATLRIDGVPQYAKKIISDPGKKNGLYWKVEGDEPQSPLGPLAAKAADEGYTTTRNEPKSAAYHGYRYRLLKAQGPNAPGGAMEYIVNGKMICGFAVVAYPVDYGNSGVMTFIVSHNGVVYQTDLGPDTAAIASQMKVFDPAHDWKMTDAAIQGK
jgi:hypothetical protein